MYWVLLLFLLICLFLYYENNKIDITNYNISNTKVNGENIKIVQLSDLHCKSFGKNQKILVNKILNINPDLIFFTGDLVDARTSVDNYVNSFTLIKELSKHFPIYFVSGNHEYKSYNEELITKELNSSGAIILDNIFAEIKVKNTNIKIFGFSYEPVTRNHKGTIDVLDSIKDTLDNNSLNILLHHRPNNFYIFTYYNFDLIFCGHAHGGQFRIPFIHKGIYMPDQGILPKFTEGIHTMNNSNMIISRGLGNSGFPIRLFNHPEIVVLTLKHK